MENPFIIGRYYSRQADIHEKYGGNKQSGIAASAQAPFIFLFTGGAGKAHGYHDEWDGEIFRYYGEGQIGDMTLTKGNKALAEHLIKAKAVLLFQTHGKGKPVSYVGDFDCIDHEWIIDKDTDGNERKAIIFHLVRVGVESGDDIFPATLLDQSLEELRKKAYAAISVAEAKMSQVSVRRRCSDVKAYALKRANGHCECCGAVAPFLTKHGLPYLEVHHIQKLSDFGLDSPENVAALTPNCHRRIHQGINGLKLDHKLLKGIVAKEKKHEQDCL